MAYVSKEQKAKIADALKTAFGTDTKKRGFKYSLAIDNYSTIVCTISEGTVDFFGGINRDDEYSYHDDRGHIQVNQYYIEKNFFGKVAEILAKINECLNIDNYNNSDAISDYFDVGWYSAINIGRWNKPYILK